MKIFLASEIKNEETLPKLDKFVDGINGKSIAYIPTAANGEGWQSWREGGTWKTFQNFDADITLIQLT